MSTKQSKLWSGAFGDAYVERNIVTQEDLTNRKAFWDRCLKQLYMNCSGVPESFIEFGAGQGANLRALIDIYQSVDKHVDLYATEVNAKARTILSDISSVRIVDDIGIVAGMVDCAITMGFLIHVNPSHLKQTTDLIYKSTKRWIVCAEYFSPEPRQMDYHGEQEALWASDFGKHWIGNYALRVVGYGFLWKPMTGLDNLNFWFFEKVQ